MRLIRTTRKVTWADAYGASSDLVADLLSIGLAEHPFDTIHCDAANGMGSEVEDVRPAGRGLHEEYPVRYAQSATEVNKPGTLFSADSSELCESPRGRIANASESMNRSGLREDLATVKWFRQNSIQSS